jgi:hypothetical protein
MGGGLMQLVAYGAQDIYLTGNPQITFFKVVYRRHTNFAMESIEQTFNGSVAASSTVTATISRNGDLVGRMYLEHNAATALVDATDDNYGHNIIDYVDLEIGGQRIDKQFGHWMEVWAELTEPNPTGAFTASTAGMTNGTLFQRNACAGGVNAATEIPGLLHIPLQFWFCRNPGLALPLIALQYHEVKVKVAFTAQLVDTNANLWVDYIYLDTDERRRFAQVSHEYLIEQVQHESHTGGSMTLNFNHPVKELVWAGAAVNASGLSTPIAVGTGTYKLTLNGHDRFAARDYRYFTRAQVWQHHTGYGSVSIRDSVAVYSFALNPEEHQPSGTCNFSRIDNAKLVEGTNTTAVNVYAVNYNVLRIMSGMGGLAYSN